MKGHSAVLQAAAPAARPGALRRTRALSLVAGKLSRRELQVLQLLVHGCRDCEIAVTLGITLRTGEHHVAHILTKLNVPNRTAAACVAAQLHLVVF
jgi:DNA-binding NarL/FixJ family response regulator